MITISELKVFLHWTYRVFSVNHFHEMFEYHFHCLFRMTVAKVENISFYEFFDCEKINKQTRVQVYPSFITNQNEWLTLLRSEIDTINAISLLI